MLLCANAALEENKQRINELNVFPVPDGDTGTNMSLTMNSAAIELGRKQTDTVGAVADCAASALLRGARGNSGVILSLLFRGIAKSLKGRENANAAEFAAAVSAGVDAAYKAVMKPAVWVRRPPWSLPRRARTLRPCSRRCSPLRARRWPTRRTSTPCCAAQVWSTPAARASCSSWTPCSAICRDAPPPP